MGNPIGFHLTPGQSHDLEGSDALLPQLIELDIEALLADKAYDAEARVLNPLAQADIEAVIPSKANRSEPRDYDTFLYRARHLIENLFAKLKQYRGIATRYDKRGTTFLSGVYLAATVITLT